MQSTFDKSETPGIKECTGNFRQNSAKMAYFTHLTYCLVNAVKNPNRIFFAHIDFEFLKLVLEGFSYPKIHLSGVISIEILRGTEQGCFT